MTTFRFPVLMVQGTTSDAGKSTVVAGLCRLLMRRKIGVVPFKPQNMALNSAVTIDGGEIGRAQALQARAAGLAPHTDMNPVLLKPSSDTGAQVIIHGHVRADMDACAYHEYKRVAMGSVLESYQRLRQRYAAIIVEGAGSPAEINLRDRDIANMGFAEAVDCPVILVADIDRGGVFAHFVGTLACLSASEQARIVGFVINRFRGDLSLLQPGIDWLERETGKPVLAVVPYLHGLVLEAEDAVDVRQTSTGALKVVVPVYPHMSNHTDFDALRAHPDVDLTFVGPGQIHPPADLIILPGSKNTRTDLAWLRHEAWDRSVMRHLRYGGRVLGICGGFQMLGTEIHDPHGVEAERGSSEGLGIFDMRTTLEREKILRRVEGYSEFLSADLRGYEIHMGQSVGPALERPLCMLDGRPDGAVSADDNVIGSYVHGIFDHPQALQALLHWAGLRDAEPVDIEALCERSLDRVADAMQGLLDRLDAL